MNRTQIMLALAVIGSLLHAVAMAAGTGLAGASPGEEGFWAPVDPPRAQYAIDCRIDPERRTLEGTETIRLTNDARRPITRLAMYQQVRDGNTLAIECRGKTLPALQKSRYAAEMRDVLERMSPFEFLEYTVFDLPQPLRPGGKIELRVRFATPIAQCEAFYLVDWHPRLYWGCLTHDDFDVKVGVPSGYALATSGRLDPKSGRYSASDIRTFGLVLAKGWRVKSGWAGDVLVQSVYPEGHEEWAQTVQDTAVDAISFYRRRFGFYPYRTLSVVLGGNFPLATNIITIHEQRFDKKERTTRDWQWSTAHEIGHMYWGEFVMNKQVPTDLLYSSNPLRWFTYPALMLGMGFHADRTYSREKGWDMSEYAVNFSWLERAMKEGKNTIASMTAEQQLAFNEWPHQNKVLRHGRGDALVSALVSLLGEDTFDRIYRQCLKDYGGRRMDVHDLQAECETATGQNLTWFFDQWWDSNAYPAFEIASRNCIKQGDRYLTEVKVKCRGTMKCPVKVAAVFEDGSRQVKSTDRLLDVSTLRFESSSPLKDVQLDPDKELPLLEPPYRPSVLDVMTQIEALPITGAGEQAARLFEEAKQARLTNTTSWDRIALNLYGARDYEKARVAWRRAECLDMSRGEYWLAFCWLTLQGMTADLLSQRDEAIRCYTRALECFRENCDEAAYKGIVFNCTPLGIRFDPKWVEERLKTPFERK